MQDDFTLTYSRPLVRRAVGRFWVRAVGWKFFAALLVVLFSLILALRRGDRSWFVGALGFAALLGTLLPVAVYVAQYRRAIGAFRMLADGLAQLSVKDDGFRVTSAAGYSDLSWRAVTE